MLTSAKKRIPACLAGGAIILGGTFGLAAPAMAAPAAPPVSVVQTTVTESEDGAPTEYTAPGGLIELDATNFLGSFDTYSVTARALVDGTDAADFVAVEGATVTANGDTVTVDVSALPVGQYLIAIANGDFDWDNPVYAADASDPLSYPTGFAQLDDYSSYTAVVTDGNGEVVESVEAEHLTFFDGTESEGTAGTVMLSWQPTAPLEPGLYTVTLSDGENTEEVTVAVNGYDIASEAIMIAVDVTEAGDDTGSDVVTDAVVVTDQEQYTQAETTEGVGYTGTGFAAESEVSVEVTLPDGSVEDVTVAGSTTDADGSLVGLLYTGSGADAEDTGFTAEESAAYSAASQLIEQAPLSQAALTEALLADGHTQEDIDAALVVLNANWFVQAELQAAAYEEGTFTGQDELVAALAEAGFTEEQAAHGADVFYGFVESATVTGVGETAPELSVVSDPFPVGDYTVTVTDADGTSQSANFTVVADDAAAGGSTDTDESNESGLVATGAESLGWMAGLAGALAAAGIALNLRRKRA